MNVLRIGRKETETSTSAAPDLGAAVSRLATQTSVIRARRDDSARLEANGGTAGALAGRIREAAAELERIAETLDEAAA